MTKTIIYCAQNPLTPQYSFTGRFLRHLNEINGTKFTKAVIIHSDGQVTAQYRIGQGDYGYFGVYLGNLNDFSGWDSINRNLREKQLLIYTNPDHRSEIARSLHGCSLEELIV